MIQAIIGIAALIVLAIIIKNYRAAKDLREKEEDLSDLGMKESMMNVDEKIVSKEINLKERNDKLNKDKEKLNV